MYCALLPSTLPSITLAVVECEVERVVRFVRIVRMTAQRFFPRNALALVFHHPLARRNRLAANTPLPCTPERRTATLRELIE